MNTTLRLAVTAATFAAFVLAVALFGALLGTPYGVSAAGSTANVSVFLNVSNTEPTVYDVILDDLTPDPANEISLIAGGLREVLCNASASDPNGQVDLINATASLYAIGEGSDEQSPDANANHYTNSSCLEYLDVAGTTDNRTFTCRFNVEYFAFNTTWQCNMTVRDFGGGQLAPSKVFLNDSDVDNASVLETLAINITTTVVEYGNISVTETSTEQNINITNVGNVRTNFTVLGAGGTNLSAPNAGNSSFHCTLGNISIGYHRYSNVSGAAWANMINLTYNATLVQNVTLQNRTDNTDPLINLAFNTTYWRVFVPLGIGGRCNGTIQFAASSSAS